MGFRVAVVGASGAVGGTLLRVLQERGFPVDSLRLLATSRSAGRRLRWRDSEVAVEAVGPDAFRAIEICFLAVPGSEVSRELAPQAVAAGATVIDKGSAFRMDPKVPLVVPEVNPGAVGSSAGIIASPNCTTIPLVLCLHPLRRVASLQRVLVSTYQSASGSGAAGLEALAAQSRAALDGADAPQDVFPRRLAFNVIPQCDRFTDLEFTAEEWKLTRETRKILDLPDLPLTATAVRVPVFVGHSEAVFAAFDRPVAAEEAMSALRSGAGVRVHGEPGSYPTALDAAGTDEAHVGRIRQDPFDPRALHFWVVGDNLRKGAATNAVQIAEVLVGSPLRRRATV